MDGDRRQDKTGRQYDFQAFPENVELARNIADRVSRRGVLVGDGAAAVREIADALRYVTELYGDVRAGTPEAIMEDCVNIATSAFVISRVLAPEYYEGPEDIGDPARFIKKMGDAVAMNEIDLDLGTGRWTSAVDLIMDMISVLSVLTGTLAIEAEGGEGYVPDDLDYNVLTACALMAAYALIVYQCAKNGSYRGQTLRDVGVKRG